MEIEKQHRQQCRGPPMLTLKFDVLQQNPATRNTGSIHSFIFTNYNKSHILKNL
jgi:hypothetical protein